MRDGKKHNEYNYEKKEKLKAFSKRVAGYTKDNKKNYTRKKSHIWPEKKTFERKRKFHNKKYIEKTAGK